MRLGLLLNFSPTQISIYQEKSYPFSSISPTSQMHKKNSWNSEREVARQEGETSLYDPCKIP